MTVLDRHQRTGAHNAEAAGGHEKDRAALVDDQLLRVGQDGDVIRLEREHVRNPLGIDVVEGAREVV